MLAFEHEVDAEEGGGEDVEDVREPVGEGGEEITGGGGEGLGAFGYGVDTERVREGEFVDAWRRSRGCAGGVRRRSC